MLVAPDGRVWTGTAEGAIHVHHPRDGPTPTVTDTGGRPLGLENLPDGRILVCDAHRGLLALDPATGELETLLTEVDGDRLLFTNNAAVTPDGDARRLEFDLPAGLARYCVEKGSISLNGISLTINTIEPAPDNTRIGITVIPHTWDNTNLSAAGIGDEINVEVDVIAKYVEALCKPYPAP